MIVFSAFDWPGVTGALALLDLALVLLTLAWVLTVKREPTSAMAWCLLVILVPIIGMLLFVVFGYQSVHPPLKKKRRHAQTFHNPLTQRDFPVDAGYEGLAELAQQLGAQPMLPGNLLELYDDGASAYEAMLEAIKSAKHHVHMEFFIARGDDSGLKFMHALAERARAGARVRFLYDAMGSWKLHNRALRILTQAGGQAVPFLPLLNPLRRRIQINLRNHRKILVVDGKVAFTGGLNLGDEYLGMSRFFGPWRDTFVRVEGPAVEGMQRVFAEDWDFASDEELGPSYFPPQRSAGHGRVQVAWSGPDQDRKTIREVYFAAIMRARKRVWLATPYFVPDASLLDALCLAARSGRDVRVVCPFRPDKWVPHLASRYYWGDLLQAGGKVYQYTTGFYHTKLLLVDDAWASIGTPNFDNRSLYLNFELTCLVEDQPTLQKVEKQFLSDMSQSIRLTTESFGHRPFVAKMAENVCRLLSPVL